MQRTALRRAGLVVAPLLLAAAGAVATATPAAADCTNVVSCTASNNGGTLHAGVSYITVSVSGGHYASKAATVEVPNQVPPPCWYKKGRSGAEMYADSKDPYYYGLAHHVGEDHDDWFPPIVDQHKDDDGNFYSWECSSGNFDGSIKDFFKYVDEWSAQNPALIWVPAGQAPPQPPVPTEILMAIATDAMDKAVRMPTVNFNPASRSFVRLDTWMWFDQAAWDPIVVTAAGGGNQVTLTATPTTVGVSGLPAGSEARTGCAGGGKAYAAGGSTDCMIRFNQSSGGQPGQQWHFQVSLNWHVTSDYPLVGPDTITRTENEALTVLEAQAVAGTPPGN